MGNIRKNKKHWDKYLYSNKFISFPRKEVIQYGKYLGCFWIKEENYLTTSW